MNRESVDSEAIVANSMAPAATLETFCTLSSQQMGEQLFGTASETSVWLALEYPYPWGAKALPESALPDELKAQLRSWEKTIPRARLQLIKQHSLPLRTAQVETIPGQPIAFFVSLAREGTSTTYRFSLERYADLLEIDLPAFVWQRLEDSHSKMEADHAMGPISPGPHASPLYLVCTNGKRDRCCAKWGLPVYQALRDYAGDSVWQTTHTGGHRFSATLVCLPQGAMYGWVDPTDAQPLIAAHEAQQIYRLDRYRGRSCYTQPVQAADYYLRARTGALELDKYALVDVDAIAENQWKVAFQEAPNAVVHHVGVASRRSDAPFLGSCVKVPAYVDQFYEA